MVSLNAISIAIFYLVIALLIYRNKHKISWQGIILLYRTQRGIKTINYLAKYKKFWRGVGYSAVPIGYIGMIFILGQLTKSVVDLVREPAASPGVSIVIPGVHVPGSEIFIPFWYGIISLILLIVVHEGAHGVIARAHDIKIKNTGLGMFLFIPLAFVEPEEKQLRKKPFSVQASVFAAGSMANFALAGLAFLLLLFVVSPMASSVVQMNGVEINEVLEGLPAEGAGLQATDLVNSINGVEINSTEVLSEELLKISPGETVNLGTSNGEFSVTTTTNPQNESRAYLGISFKPNIELKPEIESKYWKIPWVLILLVNLLAWTLLLNVGIGLFNLLPLGFVDGGRMAQVALNRFIPQEDLSIRLFMYISLFALLILLLNIFGPILF